LRSQQPPPQGGAHMLFRLIGRTALLNRRRNRESIAAPFILRPGIGSNSAPRSCARKVACTKSGEAESRPNNNNPRCWRRLPAQLTKSASGLAPNFETNG
jgi:hypothetical protein